MTFVAAGFKPAPTYRKAFGKSSRANAALDPLMQPVIDPEQYAVGDGGGDEEQEGDRHHGLDVGEIDRVDDHEAQALLAREHFADDDAQERQREADPEAGDDLGQGRGHYHGQDRLPGR